MEVIKEEIGNMQEITQMKFLTMYWLLKVIWEVLCHMDLGSQELTKIHLSYKISLIQILNKSTLLGLAMMELWLILVH
jgi:hypothetical protein